MKKKNITNLLSADFSSSMLWVKMVGQLNGACQNSGTHLAERGFNRLHSLGKIS